MDPKLSAIFMVVVVVVAGTLGVSISLAGRRLDPSRRAGWERVGLWVGGASGFAVGVWTVLTLERPSWTTFASPEGGFVVRLPVEPTARLETVATPSGPAVWHVHDADAPFTSWHYHVLWVDLPRSVTERAPSELYAERRDELVRRTGGRLLEERAVSAGGLAGCELRLEVSPRRVIRRDFLVGTRLHVLLVDYPARDPDPGRIRPFLDSFELTAPSPR